MSEPIIETMGIDAIGAELQDMRNRESVVKEEKERRTRLLNQLALLRGDVFITIEDNNIPGKVAVYGVSKNCPSTHKGLRLFIADPTTKGPQKIWIADDEKGVRIRLKFNQPIELDLEDPYDRDDPGERYVIRAFATRDQANVHVAKIGRSDSR